MKIVKRFSIAQTMDFYTAEDATHEAMPFMLSGVQAGFPSPADDYIDLTLDLNQVVIKNKSATFYARVKGNSMINDDIHDGDILVVDKSILPTEGIVAVCFIDGEFTLKRIHKKDNRLFLLPSNPTYPPIEVGEQSDFRVWGVVTYIIKKI